MPAFNHYICKSHLKLFLPDTTPDRKLHVFSKKEGYKGMRSYAKIAGAMNAYPPGAEKQMGVIEGRAIEVIRGVARGVKFNIANPKHREQWYALFLYMALTACRHPDTLAEWRGQAWRQISTHPMLLTHWREMRVQDALFEGLFNQVIPFVVQPLDRLLWCTIRIVDRPDMYAISDRGVIIGWGGTFGTPTESSLVILPVSNKALLVGAADVQTIRPLRHVPAEAINAFQLYRSHEYIFSTELLNYEEMRKHEEVIEIGQRLWTEKHGVPQQPAIEVWAPFRTA